MRALVVLLIMGCGSKQPEVPPQPTPGSDATVAIVANAPIDAPPPDAAEPDAAVMDVPPRDQPIPQGEVAANHPTAKFLVTKTCSLSPHPPSTYYWSTVTTYDLEAGKWTSEHREGNEERLPQAVKPARPGKPPEVVGPKIDRSKGEIAADRKAAIETALAHIFAGKQYPPKYPRSGGSRCSLSLFEKGQPPFFQIDRADNEIKDAVTELLLLL